LYCFIVAAVVIGVEMGLMMLLLGWCYSCYYCGRWCRGGLMMYAVKVVLLLLLEVMCCCCSH
jgi:hypothetical protein